MKDYLEIKFWQIAIWIIRKWYGADCSKYVKECPSCRAKEVIKWIEGHIQLIKDFR